MFGRIAAKSALFLLAASVGAAPASATEYFTTSVVGVFYGVETVLSPTGAVVSPGFSGPSHAPPHVGVLARGEPRLGWNAPAEMTLGCVIHVLAIRARCRLMESHRLLVLRSDAKHRVSKDAPVGDSCWARTGAPFDTAAPPPAQDEVEADTPDRNLL